MLPRILEGCSCGTDERMRADPHAAGMVRSCAPGRRNSREFRPECAVAAGRGDACWMRRSMRWTVAGTLGSVRDSVTARSRRPAAGSARGSECAACWDRSLSRACGPLRSRLGIRFVRGSECGACWDRSLSRACGPLRSRLAMRFVRGPECAACYDRSLSRACGRLRSRLGIRSVRGSECASPGAWRKPGNRRVACRAENGGRNPLGMAAAAQAARRRRPEEAFFAARFRGAARRAGRSFFRLMVPRQPGAPQRHLTCSTSGSKR